MSRADTGEPTAPGKQAVPEAGAPGRARKLRLMSVRTSRGSPPNLHGIIDVPTEQNMQGLASIPSSSWRKSLYGPRQLGRRSDYARTGHGRIADGVLAGHAVGVHRRLFRVRR
jgi:hypothetical protein